MYCADLCTLQVNRFNVICLSVQRSFLFSLQENDEFDYPETTEVESEYVGDSEFADNEFDLDDDVPLEFSERPNIAEMINGLNFADEDEESEIELQDHNYQMHPNQYLPNWTAESNPNIGVSKETNPQHRLSEYTNDSELGDPSNVSGLDDMSVSMGGYTSTNASCSDISGLCEIDDSENNFTDDEVADAELEALAEKIKSGSVHQTQV